MKFWENVNDPILENEVWKIVKDFPDYQISNFGRIKSFKYDKINGKIRKQYKRGKYFYIKLWKDGKYKNKLVHRLVFEIHNNYKLKDDECVHHIDEDKENNILENLESIPEFEHLSFHNLGKYYSEKSKKKMSKNHADFKGEKHPRHKLTEEQVIQIKLLLKEGILTQKEIAYMFRVSTSTISDIKNNRKWNHIGVK